MAGTLLGTDPARARREIGDVETVAHRSLGEVREAVTGYRTPTLAAELVAARQSTVTAGINCQHSDGGTTLAYYTAWVREAD